MAKKPPTAQFMQRKDQVTRWHQWVTLAGIPAGLSILGWIALSINGIQIDNAVIKAQILEHTQQLERIWGAIGSLTKPHGR